MNIRLSRSMVVSFAVLWGSAEAAAEQSAGTKVYLNGTKSAVCFIVPSRDGRSISMGSGVVVNLKNGYFLTNWHVVQGGAGQAGVIFPAWTKGRPVVDKEKYERRRIDKLPLAKVLVSDEQIDLAILKMVDPLKIPKEVSSVRFASDSPLTGSKIHSIGNPAASDAWWVYTPGEVRSVYTKTWEAGGGKDTSHHKVKIIEATSPTTHGDSGGPCFNDNCELVGITQGGISAGAAQGYSFFIDAGEAKKFLTRHRILFNQAEESESESTVTAPTSEPKPEPMTRSSASDNARVEKKKASEPSKEAVPESGGETQVKPEVREEVRLEKEAANKLNAIRSFAKDPTKRTFAIEALQKLIKAYPKTEAAKEAQNLLDKIQ